MDDNLYQDDFEEFLQDQVGNQRMYPSDAVWRNINKELHGENRWPALTISAFVLLMATVGVCIHFSPKPNIFAVTPAQNYKARTITESDQIANLSSPSFLNRSEGNSAKATNNLKPVPADNLNSATSLLDSEDNFRSYKNKLKAVSSTASKVSTGNLTKVIPMGLPSVPSIETTSGSNALSSFETRKGEIVTIPVVQSGTGTKTPSSTQPIPDNDKNMVDNFLKEHKNDLSLYTTTQVKNLKNRFSYVIYVAPSVSYRKLKEDRSGIKDNTGSGGGPLALNYVTDVNKVVRHKPGTGIEAGFGVIYNLTNKIRLRSGLQFNIRQYNIEAYKSLAEPASIALISGGGIDTVNTFSVYRTNNGYIPAELQNRYYQLAVPLGLEWEIIGNKSIKLNIAGSIQPTYLLNKNAYLLSTNYKNYTESSGMVNSWNLNSNVEAFISFKVGDFKWQVGPQLRYQHFSTFISPYPIKEHLMDYGFKLGVSKVIL